LIKKLHLKTLIPTVLLFHCFWNFGQDSLQTKPKYRNLIKEAAIDIKDVAISPIKWDKKEWIIAGSVAATSAVLYSFDDDIREYAQENRNDFTNNLSTNFFDPMGDGRYLVG